MKAMVLKGPNTPFEMTQVPDPVAGPGEAVVVERAGLEIVEHFAKPLRGLRVASSLAWAMAPGRRGT